jgi:hypothetical protein
MKGEELILAKLFSLVGPKTKTFSKVSPQKNYPLSKKILFLCCPQWVDDNPKQTERNGTAQN